MCGRLLVRAVALVAKCLYFALGDCRLTVLREVAQMRGSDFALLCETCRSLSQWLFLLLANAGSILPLSAAFWLFDKLYLLQLRACGMKGCLKLSSGLGPGGTVQ